MSFFEFPHTRTYDGDLGWLIKHVSSYDEVITALNEWIENYTPKVEEVLDFMNQLESGYIPEGMKSALYEWARTHLLDLVAQTLKTVAFELTDDGYFVAYFSDSWSEITFNTTELDIWLESEPEYGHLVLTY